MSVCVSVSLSVSSCLSIYLSIYLCVYLYRYPFEEGGERTLCALKINIYHHHHHHRRRRRRHQHDHLSLSAVLFQGDVGQTASVKHAGKGHFLPLSMSSEHVL